MEDEEVPLVDGVFKDAFGALGDENGLEVKALVDVIEWLSGEREFRNEVGDGVLAREVPSSSSSSPWLDEDPK
ncbi:hypothetical protein Tco_1511527 [Tanacetum coccineum]